MKINSPTNFSNIASIEDLKNQLSQTLASIVTLLNGKVTLGDNVSITKLEAKFAAANVSQGFSHTLGTVPSGYIVTKQTANMTVFDGTTANSSTVLYLKSSAVGTATLWIF